MAIGQRELWLTLRVRNEATRELRAMSRSIQGIDFTGAQRRVDISAERSRVLQQARMAELRQKDYLAQVKSYEIGLKALQLEKQRADLEIARIRSTETRLKLESREADLQARMIMAQRQLARAMAARGAAVGTAEYATLAENARYAQLRVNALTKAQEANAEAMNVQAAAADRLTIVQRGLTATEAENARQIERNTALAKEQSVTVGRLRRQSSQLLQSLKNVPTKDWEALAGSVAHVGRTLALVGGVSTVVLGAMAKNAAEVSKQMTLAATQARRPGQGPQATRAISGQLFDNVLKQMQRFPASAQDMGKSLYEIFSGTNVQNIGKATNMLQTFNMMAVAGGSDLKTMTDAGISMYNNFPGQFKNMTQAANQFFAVVRYGRMNADQFAKSLSYILPIAKTAGMSFMDVGSAMAFLTRQTGAIRTTQDAMGLARLIQLMGRKDMVDGMQKLGVSVFDASGKMRPMIDIITDLRSKTNMTNKEVLNFFKTTTALGSGKAGTQGTIQALRVFSQIYEHVKAANDVAKKTRGDVNEMIKSFQAMSRDPGVRWTVFTNQLHVLSLTIGRDLIPTFARIGSIIARLVQWFNGLSPHVKKLISEWLAWGAVGTFVVGALAAIGGGIVIFIFRVGQALKWIKDLKLGIRLVGEEAGLVNPVLAAGMGLLVLIPLMVKFHKQIGEVIDKFGGLKNITELIIGLLAIKMVKAWGGVASAAVRSVATQITAETALQASTVATTGKLNLLRNALLMLGRRAWPVVVVETVIHARSLEAWMRKNAPGFRLFDDFMKGKIGPGAGPGGPRQPEGARGLTPAQITRGQQIIARLPAGQRGMTPGQITAAWHAQQAGARRAAAANHAASVSLEHFMRIFMRLRQLQAQFAVAPTMALAKQITSLEDKMKKASPAQQAYFTQLGQNLGAVKLISDRTVLAMARNVDRLRKAFERAPSIATYRAWYQANKQFTTLATQDQQQFAQDTIAANQAATDKIKQNFQTTLQFIRGMYNQFLSEMQTAFGQLGQGPFMTGLENRVQQIRDQGSKQAQALRDQAQKIQDGAKDAEKSITATEGNLIDWGLKLDTSLLNKKATDAAVKALNDRADRLEKIANARADKLAKRLAAHKLTPRELSADLRSQVHAFETWQRHLRQLQRRGAPRELINQLRQLGPGYDNMLKGLLGMNRRQFANYVRLFTRGQREIQKAALEQTREQLKAYRKYGRNIANAIAAGIQDEAPSVTRALTRLTRQTLGTRAGTRRAERLTRQNTIHIQHNTGALRNNTNHIRRHTTRVQQNSRTLQSHGRTVQRNSTRLQQSSTYVRRNNTELNNNTKALHANTAAITRHPRPHTVHHVDPRRHQNPPQHVEHNNYHYHADRSHHMSYEAWLRKQHFIHRNQRRC
jgi:TP901 family phage tail tape measure protein